MKYHFKHIYIKTCNFHRFSFIILYLYYEKINSKTISIRRVILIKNISLSEVRIYTYKANILMCLVKYIIQI